MNFNWKKLIPETVFRKLFDETPRNNIYSLLFDSGYLDQTLAFLMNRAPLWKRVSSLKPKRVMEIGLGNGLNALVMLSISDCEEYYCFDWLKRSESVEVLNILNEVERFRLFEGNTLKTLPRLAESLPDMDFIFIDGGHQYDVAKNDWKHSELLMREDSEVWFHDFGFTPRKTGDLDGVYRAVMEIDTSKYNVKRIKTEENMPDYARVTKRKEKEVEKEDD